MTTTPKLGRSAAPKFLEPRFKKDAWITDATLRSRGASMRLMESDVISQLETPSLMSSSHGGIARVLMTIPWWVFLQANEVSAEEWESISATADSLKSMLRLLPGTTKFVILVHERAIYDGNDLFGPPMRLAAWLTELELTARAEVVLAPSTMRFTIWAEDAYAVSRDTTDAEVYFVEPASFRRYDDALIADIVAVKTDLEQAQAILYFQGGNILIGDNFWLIGADYPQNSLRLGYIKPNPGESERDAVARSYGAALDRSRRFMSIGSRLPVPGFPKGELRRPFQLDGQTWHEKLYLGNHEGTVQPLFHIDMFLTLAGRDSAGRYVVAVGDPRLAAQLLGQTLQAHAMVEVFDDIADQLSTLGFVVMRTPLPLTYDDDASVRERTWYFATSNNALVQVTDTTKDIWLPTYGHRKWTELRVTDQANKTAWEQIGFTVHQLGDFHPFAVNLGAAHCVKKYLSR